jgi:hypothetical protein
MALAYRRYLISAIRTATATGLPAAAAVLLSNLAEQPGTPLPSTFPHRDLLAVAHYTVFEDLAGADLDELVRGAGLTQRQAKAVLGAL